MPFFFRSTVAFYYYDYEIDNGDSDKYYYYYFYGSTILAALLVFLTLYTNGSIRLQKSIPRVEFKI
jgi:hypothetical protein